MAFDPKTARKCTAFNIEAKDCVTKNQDMIREIVAQHLWGSMQKVPSNVFINTISVGKINKSISNIGSNGATFLYNYMLKGVGPGEFLLYFILNKASLGGGGRKELT